MLETLRHLLRLFIIARILVRYDALFPLEALDLGLVVAWTVRILGGRPDKRFVGKRQGERLAAAMQELGPTFIKLGQLVSTRPDLVGESMAADLAALRDQLKPFSPSEVRNAVETEFSAPLETLFSSFQLDPIAAASIAQVHLAVTDDNRNVAVKVLRPGIERAFQRDLALFLWIADIAELRHPAIRRLRPVAVIQTLADITAIEMDLRLEAAAASELKSNFLNDARLEVPEIDWQRTARRVMTSSRVEGISINDKDKMRANGIDLSAVAVTLIQTFLEQVFRDGFFHADLHHGNLFVTSNGTIQVVDFGIMGRLEPNMRHFFAELLLAFLDSDYRRAAELHLETGILTSDQSVESFAQACRSIGEPILGLPANRISIGRLLGQLLEVTKTFSMETQPQLLMLQKTMVVVEGVARGLDPELDIWKTARTVVEPWVQETLAPDARLRDSLHRAAGAAKRIPDLISHAEHAAASLTSHGFRLHPDSAKAIAVAQARHRRPLNILIGVVVALLAVALIHSA